MNSNDSLANIQFLLYNYHVRKHAAAFRGRLRGNMKSLVIAEKPSVARDIARVLKCGKKLDGALEGDQYIITWGLGHLVTLSDPEGYDPKYKEWNMAHLPMMPDRFKLEVIKQTGKQFNAVKTQLYRKDVAEVIIATDAGREGELVARLILTKAGSNKPCKRLWISSVTDKAIREGFSHLKDAKEYDNLYAAALSRSEADWLVGINATRALTCKYNAQLSCGRVQTPTLAMIAAREDEIKRFRPVPYYGITAKGTGVVFSWQDKGSGSYSSFDKERVAGLLKQLPGSDLRITEVKRSPKKTPAPLLYDLTELQREANRRFNFSAKDTLNIMQRLYENHKVLTYPRTDSRYLSSDVVDTLKERIQSVCIGPYKKAAGRLIQKTFSKKEAFVNDAKVSDHHAIIPTEQFVQLDHMTVDERKIYDLVVKRFLAVMYPPFEYEQTSVKGEARGEIFTAKGKVVKNPGWKEVYESVSAGSLSGTEYDEGYGDYEDAEDGENASSLPKDQRLPELKEGEVLKNLSYSMTEGKTKPPAPFNEATLLSAMENPARFMESKDKEVIRTLSETGGLGTVATRADIIEKLFSSFLLEKKGKDIVTTSKGRQLLSLVPADLRKPELTADWEMQLQKISKGSLDRNRFMKEIQTYTVSLIDEIKGGEGSFRHDNLTNTKCPQCGKRMLLVSGKNSRMLVCQDRECGYRETVSRTSNARCPQCHKKMELTGTGEKQMFVCSCGHKEKLAAFKERREKEGAGVNKRDVAKYLQQQNKKNDEPLNNAFAQAFAGLNLNLEKDNKK